jgi:hypothetical protein
MAILISSSTCILVLVYCFYFYFHDYYFHWKQQQRENTSAHELILSSCPNPNCVRCQKYRQVQRRAKSRLPWICKQVQEQYPNQSLDRVRASIQHPQQNQNHTSKLLQAPTVLMVRDLPSNEIVTHYHYHYHYHDDAYEYDGRWFGHPHDATQLSWMLQEVQSIPDDWWNVNDTPSDTTTNNNSSSTSSRWKVLPLLNQGSWNDRVVQACPQLYKWVRSLPNRLDDCLFGNCMVSKIYPGTRIEPHCGPTNVRHRLQYVLQVPTTTTSTPTTTPTTTPAPELSLRVGRHAKLQWNTPGDVFVFDDSFVHSVQFESASGSTRTTTPTTCRMVLIVDLWHPDLTAAERTLIRYLYPPFVVASQPQKDK